MLLEDNSLVLMELILFIDSDKYLIRQVSLYCIIRLHTGLICLHFYWFNMYNWLVLFNFLKCSLFAIFCGYVCQELTLA